MALATPQPRKVTVFTRPSLKIRSAPHSPKAAWHPPEMWRCEPAPQRGLRTREKRLRREEDVSCVWKG